MALKILPVFKKVDTCAAEFKSFTPYMYSTYQRNFSINSECEADPSSRKKIIILGGGPNRIGQGIEFDYCCCQASFSLKDAGLRQSWLTVTLKLYQQIMILVTGYILSH